MPHRLGVHELLSRSTRLLRSVLALGVLFALGCEDTELPVWPAEGDLELVRAGADTARVSWPSAEDNEGVVGYRIFRSDDELTSVAGDARAYTVRDLEEASEVRVSVEAYDEAGNTSARLHLMVRTIDETPPHWTVGIPFVSREDEAGQAFLSWSAAEDNVGVSGYRIRRGEEVVAELDGDTTTHVVEGETAGLELEAFDEAGNDSRRVGLRDPRADAETLQEAVAEDPEDPGLQVPEEAPPHLANPLREALRGRTRSPAAEAFLRNREERGIGPEVLRQLVNSATGEHVGTPMRETVFALPEGEAQQLSPGSDGVVEAEPSGSP